MTYMKQQTLRENDKRGLRDCANVKQKGKDLQKQINLRENPGEQCTPQGLSRQ